MKAEEFILRPMEKQDREAVISLMRSFYSSPAILSSGSQEIFERDVEVCLSDSPFLQGTVFEHEGILYGYAMTAFSWSAEFGKPCLWIEDLYLVRATRGLGLGSLFLKMLARTHPESVLRLEVEEDNIPARRTYAGCGFEDLPYLEMIRLPHR